MESISYFLSFAILFIFVNTSFSLAGLGLKSDDFGHKQVSGKRVTGKGILPPGGGTPSGGDKDGEGDDIILKQDGISQPTPLDFKRVEIYTPTLAINYSSGLTQMVKDGGLQ